MEDQQYHSQSYSELDDMIKSERDEDDIRDEYDIRDEDVRREEEVRRDEDVREQKYQFEVKANTVTPVTGPNLQMENDSMLFSTEEKRLDEIIPDTKPLVLEDLSSSNLPSPARPLNQVAPLKHHHTVKFEQKDVDDLEGANSPIKKKLQKLSSKVQEEHEMVQTKKKRLTKSNRQQSTQSLDVKSKHTYVTQQLEKLNMTDKEIFMNDYSINFDVPKHYVYHSLFFPKDSSYSLSVQSRKYHQDYDRESIIQKQYKWKKEPQNVQLDENNILDNETVFRLSRTSEAQITTISEFPYEDFTQISNIEFSRDGEYLLIQETIEDKNKSQHSKIKLLRATNVEDLMEDIKQNNNVFEIDVKMESQSQECYVQFDKQTRFITAHNQTEIKVFNLKGEIIRTFNGFQKKINGSLLQVHLNSSSDSEYLLCGAFNMTDSNQILVVEINHRNELPMLNKVSSSDKRSCDWDNLFIINYKNIKEIHLHRDIKFSNDMSEALFLGRTEGINECFILQKLTQKLDGETETKYLQRGLQYLNDITVISARFCYLLNCFIILCEGKDKLNLEIYSSRSDKPLARIGRKLVKDQYKVLDMYVSQTEDQAKTDLECYNYKDEFRDHKDNFKLQLKVSSMRDVEWLIDQVCIGEFDPKKPEGAQKVLKEQHRINFRKSSIQSFCWPYIAIYDEGNSFMLVSCFLKNVVNEIFFTENPEEKLIHMQITDSFDIFLLTRHRNQYKLVNINLDQLKNLTEQHDKAIYISTKFTYHKEEVKGEISKGMWIRGENTDTELGDNKQLCCFIQHGQSLYSYGAELNNMTHNPNHGKKLQLVTSCLKRSCSVYMHGNDQLIFVVENQDQDGLVQSQKILKIKINYSFFVINTVYKEDVEVTKQRIVNINFDHSKNKILILSSKNIVNEWGKADNEYIFGVFDIPDGTKPFKIAIHNQQIIQVIRFGQATIIDGYIYDCNTIMKIRYDLLQKHAENPSEKLYNENSILDIYDNVLACSSNDSVCRGSPILSDKCHRLAYLIQHNEDLNQHSSFRIMIVPYLHERKMILNLKKPSAKYFFNLIETKEQSRKDIEIFKRRSSVRANSAQSQSNHTAIMCMNVTENKYHNYFMNGMLINRVDFKDKVKEFGKPIAVSPNGRVFVFNKKQDQLKEEECEKPIKCSHKFTICWASLQEMIEIKTIDVYEQIQDENHQIDEWMNNLKVEKKLRPGLAKLQAEKTKLQKCLEKYINDINEQEGKSEEFKEEFIVCVNDQMDVFIKFDHEQETQDKSNSKTFMKSIYGFSKSLQKNNKTKSHKVKEADSQMVGIYFESGKHEAKHEAKLDTQTYLNPPKPKHFKSSYDDHRVKKKFLHWEEHDHKICLKTTSCQVNFIPRKNDLGQMFKFNLNLLYFIKFDNKTVQVKKINDSHDEYHQLNLQICKQREVHIVDTKVSVNPHILVIVIDENTCSGRIVVYIWDITHNVQINAYKVSKDYTIIFEQNGNPLIIDDQMVVLSMNSSKVKTFHLDQDVLPENQAFYQRGLNFDMNGHMFILGQQQIYMSFSYMTFVVGDNLVKENKAHVYDPELTNYIFYRQSGIFKNIETMGQEFFQKEILQNLEKTDPQMLGLLSYPNSRIIQDKEDSEEQISALKLCFDLKLLHDIETLLEYFSKIDNQGVQNIKDDISECLLYNNILEFFRKQEITTNFMKTKQSLKVYTKQSNDIVALTSYTSLNLGETFYEDFMNQVKKDDKLGQTFPVKMIAIRVDWIVQSKGGPQFLVQLYKKKRMDLYDIQGIQLIIQFMYEQIKNIYIWGLIPLHMCQIILFIITMVLSEMLQSNDQGTNNSRLLQATPELSNTTEPAAAVGMGVSDPKLDMLGPAEITHTRYFNALWVFMILQLIVTFIELIFFIYKIVKMWNLKRILLRDYSNHVNFVSLVFLFIYCFNSVLTQTQDNHTVQGRSGIESLRIYEVFVLILLVVKFTSFLQLNKNVSPLIFIIQQIFSEIFYFMIIYITFICTFSVCFYIISGNQVQFDGVNPKDISYSDIQDAIIYTWQLSMGETDTSLFHTGRSSQELVLHTIFIVASFVLQIHFLNMLIAIMGNTFAKIYQKQSQIMYETNLKFVIENWEMIDLALGDTTKHKFLIGAFHIRY